MSKDKCGCGCGCGCGCEEEDELVFFYCSKCHRRLTVAEESKTGKAEPECCGKKMINLNEIPSMAGTIFECRKCGAQICVEEDCECVMEGRECSFECCGEKMEAVGSVYDNDGCCGDGCSDDCCDCCSSEEAEVTVGEDGRIHDAHEHECNCGCCDDDEEFDDECGCCDDGLYLVCPKCRGIVSVITPCECESGCGIKCCGVKMEDTAMIPDNSGKYFKCAKCGSEIFMDCDSDIADASKYEPVKCCGAIAEITELTEDDKDPGEFMEDAPAYFCTECERLVFVSEGKTDSLECCGRKMIDVTDPEKHDGELYTCSKCGLKLIIENDCLCKEGGHPCDLVCCGERMQAESVK